MKRFGGVLFDLDGTLLDTLQDLGDSLNRVLTAHGWPTHGLGDYRYFVGEGARSLVERALPAPQRKPATISAVLAEYRADYGLNWNVATRPYAGIPDLLGALRAQGLTLGILSNKPHEMTVRCTAGYFPDFLFPALLGQREDVARKPDPAGAFEAARLMGLTPARVLYVGDTGTDMLTAKAAGMFSLGATWGFRPERELRESGAGAIIHHPLEVLGHVKM